MILIEHILGNAKKDPHWQHKLEGAKVVSFGVLHSAVPGNDYCNGNIAIIQAANDYACLCDCLHVEDLAEVLKEKGLDARPAGK